jgi:putative ABC transport system permease protein
MVRRFFALLLWCYPPAFRRRFGAELIVVLDHGWEASRGHGPLAAWRFLAASTVDALANGLQERRNNRWYSPRASRDPLMTTFLADMKFGVRLLRRNPQLAVLAVATLALGIGLSVSLYSVAHATLVSPLPFRDESRVVMMYEHAPQKGNIRGNVAPANFLDWRERTSSFEAMGALNPVTTTVMSGSGEAVRANGRRVLGDAFPALGLEPLLGRVFTSRDERPGNDVVLLSHHFWQHYFAGDPAIVGRTITVDERPHTVVGVLKPVLRVPGGPVGFDDLFIPWVLMDWQRRSRGSHISEAVARIRDGVTFEQAQADVARVAAALAQEFPQWNEGETVLLVPLREVLVGDVRPALVVLVGAVTMVLLIACVNVANLLLARATARRQEMSVRAALGAARGRLVRQLLAESLVLALAAAAAGVVAAYWIVGWIRALLPEDLAAAIDVTLDWRIASLALAACVATAVLAGLAPAWVVVVRDASGAVRDGRNGRQPSAVIRRVLVTLQVALAVVLLVGAGLLTRSLLRLTNVDAGLRPHNVLTLSLELPRTRYEGPRQWQPFYERLLSELRALPGVVNAGGIGGLPFTENGGSAGFVVEGQMPTNPNEHTYVIYRLVTTGLFDTLGIPLREGRDFSSADGINSARVAIVNETLARRYWPNGSAVGKRVSLGRNPRPQDWITIVGVVGDTHHWSLAEPIDIQMYVPYTQEPNWLTPGQIAVRSAGDPMRLAAAARERVRAIDPLVPISSVETMDEIMRRSVAAPRFNLTLVGLLSVSALALATIGIYGLLAFSVSLRIREIGVRTALGASSGAIGRMVLSEGLRLTLGGILAGLLTALALTRWLDPMLFQVQSDDPVTFAGIALLLLAVSVIACCIPARRAAHIDPLTALRTE